MNMNTHVLKEFFDRWALNRTALSEYMNLTRGSVNNKLNPAHPDKFNAKQVEDIKTYLSQLHQELGELLANDLETPAQRDAAQ